MPDDRLKVDGKTYPLLVNNKNIPIINTVRSGADMVEYWPKFNGPMGETKRQTPNGIFFGRNVDTADGSIRLSPTITSINNSIDCAYLPLTIFEDFDASFNRYVYFVYRDTEASPEISVTKIRVDTDAAVYTQDSSSGTAADFGGGAVAAAFAPVIGKSDVFLGKTYVPMGENTGANTMQKLATVGVNTTDTWESSDAGVFAFSCGLVHEGVNDSFITAFNRQFDKAQAEPKTSAGHSGTTYINDDGVTPVVWTLNAGIEEYFSKPDNLYSTDAQGSVRALLPVNRRPTTKAYRSYDDFDGHMACNAGDTFFHPSRMGCWRYRAGRAEDVSLDSLTEYRPVANILNIPIRLRHYSMAAFGRNIYAIYKPTGFANSANIHILYGDYDPTRDPEVMWRPFISRTDDIIGLFIDSSARLWWVENPKDPATTSGSNTSHIKYVQLAADGSPRTALSNARGNAGDVSSCFLPQVDGNLPFNRKQLRRVSVKFGGVWTNPLTINAYRDEGASETLGTIAGPGVGEVRELAWTVGTNDKAYAVMLEFQATASASGIDDPRVIEAALYWRSPDLMRAVITDMAPENPRSLEETKNILRKLKQQSAIIQITEPGTNEVHDAEIVAVNDYIDGGQEAVELLWSRFDIAA